MKAFVRKNFQNVYLMYIFEMLHVANSILRNVFINFSFQSIDFAKCVQVTESTTN